MAQERIDCLDGSDCTRGRFGARRGRFGGWRGRMFLCSERKPDWRRQAIDSILNRVARAMGFSDYSGDEGNGFEGDM